MKPNVLYLMVDQQRFDTIAALGNSAIHTPNLNRLVCRGLAFTNGYSSCPVCIPARYCIQTGCDPPMTGFFANSAAPRLVGAQSPEMPARCGPYLAQVMKHLGYRTFGIGKFHTIPWDEELGYDTHLRSEELYFSADQRGRDAYASWIASHHPQYDFLDGPVGERANMYYVPQTRAMPAAVTVEAWASDQAEKQITRSDGKPFFGFVSFIPPHPPFAPPTPYNRLYDPDRMADPTLGDISTDFMDEQIPYMNHAVFAEDISPSLARSLKARYYGEITFLDSCIGRILEAVEKRGDGENTLIAFFSDHGDQLGDHHGWQKESFFEASCRIPLLISWPAKLPANQRRDDLVCHTDLFGVATAAGGTQFLRAGDDILGLAEHPIEPRKSLVTFFQIPGSRHFKLMVRSGQWKYIFMANGGREQLFDLRNDQNELYNVCSTRDEIKESLKEEALVACRRPELSAALDGYDLRRFKFEARPLRRFCQFDESRHISRFPSSPEEVLGQ